jgi:hypothetical protein
LSPLQASEFLERQISPISVYSRNPKLAADSYSVTLLHEHEARASRASTSTSTSAPTTAAAVGGGPIAAASVDGSSACVAEGSPRCDAAGAGDDGTRPRHGSGAAEDDDEDMEDLTRRMARGDISPRGDGDDDDRDSDDDEREYWLAGCSDGAGVCEEEY